MYDVAIVGAGVAGLAAMRLLEERGLATCVIEARDRIGGRIYTVRDPRLAHPIELGAEFIHGSAPDLVELVGEAGLVAYTIEGQRWHLRGNRLVHIDDFWERMHTVMRSLSTKGPDRSFAEFLAKGPGGSGAGEARSLARGFVEGFHAAESERISVHALADGGSPSEDPEEQRIMRIADGYCRVPEFLASGFSDRIMLDSIVERIAWKRGSVELAVRTKGAVRLATIAARAAIVTVPLGVLLAPDGERGTIRFSPPLDILEYARSRLTMGAVMRVVMLFRDRWWTERIRAAPKNASLDALSFVHGDTGDIQVWWTLHPAHLPIMVGWAGGHSALRLTGLPTNDIRDRALSSLAENLGVTKRRVASQIEGFWTHNWQADPFSRGAYSYTLVGGNRAAARLARPIENTIWIAGEAADAEGRNGTVHGAMGSGRSAAQSAARALMR
ncbi:MAG: flavin monoamine oxidase family protein [Gemmatimonadaceae bacterium]